MSCWGRFYVLGPPVERASEVAGLVECVMGQTIDMRERLTSCVFRAFSLVTHAQEEETVIGRC